MDFPIAQSQRAIPVYIVIDQDIMSCEEDAIPTIKVLSTYIDGEQVF